MRLEVRLRKHVRATLVKWKRYVMTVVMDMRIGCEDVEEVDGWSMF